jgi:Uma2 family endonuclease
MSGGARVRFKASDIWDVPDDDLRYEVIDGQLFVTPAPSSWHQIALMRLSAIIFNWVQPRALGEVIQSPIGVVLDEDTGVQPDIVYIAANRRGIISERGIEGPPDLIVEALSRSTESRDRGVKMRRYASAGVQHYWLLDLRTRTLEAYELAEDGYHEAVVCGPGSTFRPSLFPGLEIPVDSLWAA